jgi:hypothetical protein
MITLYTKKELIPNGIKFCAVNDLFFVNTMLSDDPVVTKMLKEIDCATYISPKTFLGRDASLGAVGKEKLSTGVKTLINLYTHPDDCVSLIECGSNALQLLFDLSPQISGIAYMPIPVFGYTGDWKWDVICDGVHYTDGLALMNKYYYAD